MIRQHLTLADGCILDLGCGIGMYTARLIESSRCCIGLEVDWPRVREAKQRELAVAAAVGEALPFADGTFGAAVLHEVLEHVADDRATVREVVRVLVPGGRAVIFVPNRLWPFETHGMMWRGHHHFGNIPLINYLPDPVRNRLAPHVRVYTGGSLARLFDDLPVRLVAHRQVYPGYDKLTARHLRLGGLIRRLCYWLESTPARRFGLSQLLIIEKIPGAEADVSPPGRHQAADRRPGSRRRRRWSSSGGESSCQRPS